MAKRKFDFQKRTTETTPQDIGEGIQHFIDGSQEGITRKTIALPEAQFIRVKVEAAKRRVPAYQLWGEIVEAYFQDREE